MFITGVTLRGFQRLIHNNIKEVTIDFTSPYQLILGRNGSGKSSIMGQLTPYPSHKDDFSDNGYRELRFTHAGSDYVVIDDFAMGRHSIYKEDKVLHENLNPTMMKNIIKELFGLDRMLVDILTDKKKFTTLTPTERREIIMRASGINIDLGVNILEKLKGRRSYFKEYSKDLSKRLVGETNNLPTASHVDELNKRREDIIADLNLLDELANQPTEIDTERAIADRIATLQQTGMKIAYKLVDAPVVLKGISNREGTVELAIRLKYDLDQNEIKKTVLSESIDELIANLGKNRFSKNKDDLLKELNFINAELNKIEDTSRNFIYVGNEYKIAVDTAQSLYEEIRFLFNDLPDNSNRYFNKEAQFENAERLIQSNNRRSIINNAIVEIELQLQQHKDGELVECPSCATSFIPGVRLSETTLKERLSTQLERFSEVEKTLVDLKRYDVEYKTYQQKLLDIEIIAKHFSIHSSLFKQLKKTDYTSNPPSQCAQVIEDWYSDIGKSLRYNELLVRKLKTQEDIDLVSVEDIERNRLDHLRLENLEAEYSTLIDNSVNIKNKLKSIKSYIDYTGDLKQWINEADVLVQEVDMYNEKLLINGVNRFVLNAKADLTSELTRIDKEITNIQYTTLNRDRLGNDKIASDNNVEFLEILHDELSPKSGLLGEVMNEFIDKFVTQMNNFIKTIWTYDIQIQPCRNKKGDLDFYFPVSIMGKPPSSDVTELSTGEQHICNFVFKLLIMATYNLEDYPLFLDELAGNMDDLHRDRIMKTIYDMVSSQRCTQMFLISHYQQQHGVFTQAETFVTNPDNLQTIPENYNSHAKIT